MILQVRSANYGVELSTRLGDLPFLERSPRIHEDSEMFGPDHAVFPRVFCSP